MVGCLKAVRPCRIAHIPIDTPGFQIRSRAQYHGLCVIHRAGKRLYPPDFPVPHHNFGYFRLTYGEMFCVFQGLSHVPAVILFVSLSPQGMNSRSLGFIEHLGLYEGPVYVFPHLPSKCVQLPDQMALGAPSYVRITGHQRYAVHADSKHDSFHAQSCTGQSGLTSCMAGADNHHIVCFF